MISLSYTQFNKGYFGNGTLVIGDLGIWNWLPTAIICVSDRQTIASQCAMAVAQRPKQPLLNQVNSYLYIRSILCLVPYLFH